MEVVKMLTFADIRGGRRKIGQKILTYSMDSFYAYDFQITKTALANTNNYQGRTRSKLKQLV